MTRAEQDAGIGLLLRSLRTARGVSQLELSVRATVSTRHLSFLETGRARASQDMVRRLAEALQLDRDTADALREAAGFAVPGRAREPAHSVADHAFAAAIAIEDAASTGELLAQAGPALATLGMDSFFFGTIRTARDGGRELDWDNIGGFPADWLRRYDKQHYAATDPLLVEADRRGSGFYWSDVIDRAALPRPARAMFDEAAGAGATAGFVAPVKRGDGSVRIVSMMGRGANHADRSERLALHLIGRRMIDRFDALCRPAPRTLPAG